MTCGFPGIMESERMALAFGLVVCLIGASAALFMLSDGPEVGSSGTSEMLLSLIHI